MYRVYAEPVEMRELLVLHGREIADAMRCDEVALKWRCDAMFVWSSPLPMRCDKMMWARRRLAMRYNEQHDGLAADAMRYDGDGGDDARCSSHSDDDAR